MHSKQETVQTVFMNIVLQNDGVSIEEIKNGLVFAGVWKETDNSMINSIRAIAISLNRWFEKHEIQFCGRFQFDKYSATEEARVFCNKYLLEKLYDEEGNKIGHIYQHPINLESERLELV